MKTIDTALPLVLKYACCKPPTEVALADALGLILAQEVISDIDSPPHDKSMMDGYAVRASDAEVGAELVVHEEVAAGAVPTKTIQPGTATRIMTGAPIPRGADAVVMVEHTELIPSGPAATDRVRILRPSAAAQNIMPQATCLRRNQVVLVPGTEIRPIEIGLLSEVGCTRVQVISVPTAAVLATGDELVPPEQLPGPGQIRNSNGPMLRALIEKAGTRPILLGIGLDNRQQLRTLIQRGLDHDVLLLSGGVSAGKFDLVPSVLAELGVQQVFHKVRLKPGKPLWFGVLSKDDATTLVFGLPGNPVSTLVCFELFVRPALMQMATGKPYAPLTAKARLAEPQRHRSDRPVYYPSNLEISQNRVRPLAWQGSADLRTLTDANCLALFPEGERDYKAGDDVDIYHL